MVQQKINLFSAIVVFCLAGCGDLQIITQSDVDLPESEKKESTLLTVTTVSPRMMTWDRTLLATGNIEPWQEAFVSTEAAGLSIIQLYADIGDIVHQGQVLAELQHETLSAEFEQAEAELAQAIAQLEEAHADAVRAHK